MVSIFPLTHLSEGGRLVADKLSARRPSSFILLLDYKRLAQFSAGDAGQQPFELITKDGSRGCVRDRRLHQFYMYNMRLCAYAL
jgi:hypothetical protein